MPQILDANGNPIDRAVLTEPQTARVAALQNDLITSQLDGITPARAARILRDADQSDILGQHQLFDDMLDRDAHLVCEYDKRRQAVLGLDWSIDPPANASRAEKKAAAWVEDILRTVVDDLEDVLLAAMDAVGHGFAPIELEWRRQGTEWVPVFHPRPQTWFRLSQDRRELRLRDNSGNGAEPLPFGWIMHQPGKIKTGYLSRAGILRVLIWPFMYKAYSIGDFAEFLETWGLPIIIGKYNQAASSEEKASLFRAVTALGHDARAIMPEQMAIEISKITGTGSGTPHLEMAAWADGAQSKALLGQVLSSEAKATGMGSGVADLHAEVRRDILIADARQLASTITRDLVYPLVALNVPGIDGLRRCPRWVFDLGESEDVATYAKALPDLVGVGLKIPVQWAHEKLRIPQPDGDEPVLSVARPDLVVPPEARPNPGTPAAPNSAPTDAALRAALKAASVPATFADQAALDAAIEAIPETAVRELDAMIRPALDALLAAGTPEEAAAALLAAEPDMAGDELTRRLTRAIFVADLAGRLGANA